jgi:hypothetical protein
VAATLSTSLPTRPTAPPSSALTTWRRGGALWLDALIVVGLLMLALPDRVAFLDVAAAKSDEGIRLEQLYMMSLGYQPIRELFASQGPLSLQATYPLFALLGGTLAAARMAVGIYSLAEIAAVYLLGCQVGGRLAGTLAGLLLALSPVYLRNSRTALVEIPALLPATLAILAALRYRGGGHLTWLLLSSVLLALALLIKPVVAAAGLPWLIAVLGRPDGRWRALGLAALAGLVVAVAVVFYSGPAELFDQVLRYRVGSARAEGWSPAENLDVLRDELRLESAVWLPLLIVALIGLPFLRGDTALIPASWLLATTALLLLYTPLMSKHAVVLLPPAALVVGCALSPAWLTVLRQIGGGRSDRLGRLRHLARPICLASVACVLLTLAGAATLPAVFQRTRGVVLAGTVGDARNDAYADDVSLCSALSGPQEYILVDEPYLAYLCRRRMPPSLVDPTLFRLRSGSLTRAEVVEAAQRYDVRMMLLWSDGLRDLQKFGDWVDANYRAVKIYQRGNTKDRALYLRNDASFEQARPIVRGGLPTAVQADFGGQLRLAAGSAEPAELRKGGNLAVTSEWEALAPLAVDYHVLAILSGANGQPVAQVERTLGGGGEGTAAWEVGRWTVRSFQMSLPSQLASGEYQLSLAVYDSKARQRLPRSDARLPSDSAPIGTVTVR